MSVALAWMLSRCLVWRDSLEDFHNDGSEYPGLLPVVVCPELMEKVSFFRVENNFAL